MDWYKQAVCRSMDPETFFPPLGGDSSGIKKAKYVCNNLCPVREECLEFALQHNERGVWGGTTERERVQIRKRIGKKKQYRSHCLFCDKILIRTAPNVVFCDRSCRRRYHYRNNNGDR